MFSRTVIITCVLVLTVSSAFATAQMPDKLRYKGREYALYSNPLEPKLSRDTTVRFYSLSPGCNSGNSGLERGYVATWEIVGNRLYFVDIDSWVQWVPQDELDINCRRAWLEDVVGPLKPDKSSQFASWFTGDLRVPQGKELLYVHNGYHSIFERDLMFHVNEGIVEPPTTVSNTGVPLPLEHGSVSDDPRVFTSVEIRPAVSAHDFMRDNLSPIIVGKGIGKLTLGGTRNEHEKLLGTGEQINAAYYQTKEKFVDYTSSGVQVVYQLPSNTAIIIYIYNKPRKTGTGKTSKGINWNVTKDQIVEAYGEPKKTFTASFGGPSTTYTFDGVEFRFVEDKLVRIGILPL